MIGNGATLKAYSAATEINIADSPFEGYYSGEFVGTELRTGNEQSGKITMSVSSNGEANARIENYTSGRSANGKGFIKENGDSRLTVNYAGVAATLTGKIVKTKSGHLKGVWSQTVNGERYGVVEFDLLPE